MSVRNIQKGYRFGRRIGSKVASLRGIKRGISLGYKRGRGKVYYPTPVKKVLEGNQKPPRGGVSGHLWRNKGKYAFGAAILGSVGFGYRKGLRHGFSIANYDPAGRDKTKQLYGEV